MIVLVDRGGKLAAVSDATLRVSAGSDEFFYVAARVPLRKWPSWRDEAIAQILDGLEWLNLWESRDGDYMGRAGIVSKRGDVACLSPLSAGDLSAPRLWRRGATCPDAWTPAMIAARWDERVNEKRYRIVAAHLPEDCVRNWDFAAQKKARACLAAAAKHRWQDALAIARWQPYWMPADYLETLVEG